MYSNIAIQTVTNLRKNTTQILDDLNKKTTPTFILQNSSVAAVLISHNEYQNIVEMLEDYRDLKEAEETLANDTFVPLEDVKKNIRGKNSKKSS